ncbi:BBE domain-containing protein [Microbacterium sp. YJN-G]|uniref:BBE domain-containing protein n=1 Tax=Microbacterium sp. YJN-G TaxID=2763257 RepID=UPI001877CDBB|nr:BBE domain-containing protein [Microbacterium sp. YJN-G]
MGADADRRALLRGLRDILRDAPRELTVTYMDVPPMDPSAPAGARLAAVWADADPAALERTLAPVIDLDGIVGDVSTPAYRDILMDDPRPADPDAVVPRFLGGNGLFRELDDERIDRLLEFRAAHQFSVLFLRSMGGAFGDVAQEDTAFPGRDATWFVLAGGFDIPGMIDDATRAAILAETDALFEGRLAQYGNFLDSERPEVVRAMFTEEGYERLRGLKAQWDPQNLFRRNHNIV